MEIDIIIIMTIQAGGNIKNAAEAKEVRDLLRVAEGKVGCMVPTKTATGYGYAVNAGFVYHPFQHLMAQHVVVSNVIEGALGRGDLFVVPAPGIYTIRAIDPNELMVDEPL